MLANDQITVRMVGKTDRVIYPSYERATGQTVTALSLLGQSLGLAWTRDWQVAATNHASGIYDVTLAAPPIISESAPQIVSKLVVGIRVLEAGSAPPPLPPPVLMALRRSFSVFNDGVSSLRYSTKDEDAQSTPIALNHLKEYFKGLRRRHTTIRGRLYNVLIPGRSKRIHVRIVDQLTGTSVQCHVHRMQTQQVGKLLDRRVAITGVCTYSPTGEIYRVDVETIRELESAPLFDLPPIRLVGDEDHADIIRRMRDAQ